MRKVNYFYLEKKEFALIVNLLFRPNNNEQKEQTPYCTDCTSGLQSKFSDRRTLFKTSTKVSKLMEILKQTRESNPDEKTIVFSQFTSMLNLLEEPLKREGFKICRCK